jgi:hypothetical protein
VPEERDQYIKNLEKKVLRDKIQWVNQPRNNLAFAIANYRPVTVMLFIGVDTSIPHKVY